MKIAIIGSVGIPSKYGGFETLAHQLVDHLSDKVELTVYCSSQQYTKRPKRYKNAKLEYISLNANGMQSIPYDVISILKAYKKNDVLLILGVAGVFILPFIKLFSKTKICVHIDGMEWKREKWRIYAKMYLKYTERLALFVSDSIIADNQAILANVPEKYHYKTSMITYGGNHANESQLTKVLLSKLEIDFDEYAFSVCRIVPENNIRTILNAFKKENKRIVFVGNWYDSDYGISIWQDFNEEPMIKLINPIYNQEELDALRSNCSLYIHGHSAGGTNPSLVEAISLSLNIVCYDVCFNRETLKDHGYFFKNERELRSIISEKLAYKSSKKELQEFANENYNWNKIATSYYALFKDLYAN